MVKAAHPSLAYKIVGLCYILFTTKPCARGAVAPPTCGLVVDEFFFGPYIRWADLPMVLCMGFAHGFRHDGFLSMVFCRFGQGKYDYVLIQG